MTPGCRLPLRRFQTRTGEAAVSPPRPRTPMRLLASKCCMCATTRAIGFPGSASTSAVSSSSSRLCFAHRPPPLAKRVHPSKLPLPFRVLPERARPTARVFGEAPSGGFRPSWRHQPKASTRPGLPSPRIVPSSAFRTPSTVFSALGLAGLFHPAAASRVRSSGVFPPVKPCHLIGGRCPPAVGAGPLLDGCPPCATSLRLAYRALLLTGIRCHEDGV